MASTIKLLPCPMCGGEFSIRYGHNGREAFAWGACACGIVTRNQHAATDRDAARMVAAILNRRAGVRTCRIVKSEFVGDILCYCHEFSCDCGMRNFYSDNSEPPAHCPKCGAKVEADDAD